MNLIKQQIANIITLLNLTIGISIIYLIYNSVFVLNDSSFIFIFFLIYFTAILDFVDGFIARKLNANTEFGKNLDSFADFVNYGIALPFIISYFNSMYFENTIFIYYPIIFTILMAIRLAKFNSMEDNNKTFTGLPSPAFALLIVSLLQFVWANSFLHNLNYIIILNIFFIILAFLLVKSFKYKSFKSFNKTLLMIIFILFFSALISSFFYYNISIIISLFIILYVLSPILPTKKEKI